MAVGFQALRGNAEGSSNVADGYEALSSNMNGYENVAVGGSALQNNDDSENTAVGYSSMQGAYGATSNTAVGYATLLICAGVNNTAIGFDAGSNVYTGSNNIYISDCNPNTGTSDDGTVESNIIRIGDESTQIATYIAGISGETVASNAQIVVVDSTGKLGTVVAGAASIDSRNMRNTIAKLAASNVKLEQCNIKLEAAVAAQANAFAQQQQEIATLTASLKEQASLLQKVSAQVELNRPAPQVVSNNR